MANFSSSIPREKYLQVFADNSQERLSQKIPLAQMSPKEFRAADYPLCGGWSSIPIGTGHGQCLEKKLRWQG
ncbi:MAG: hypothetical protein OEL83_14570 [Desulforhopalus sp.]|nr:hypothetical protein [Desulforhopalus sp.]